MNHVSLGDKKDFIRWFLQNFNCKIEDSLFLLNYLMVNDNLLSKVHFTDQPENLSKSILISTTCVSMPSFQFVKNNSVSYKVSSAFHDIRLNPDEDIYISLFFKNWKASPQYAAVLEESPMKEYETTQSHMISLLAEITLDQVIRKQRKKQLYKEIDEALETGDQSRFLQLTNELNKLNSYEVH